MVIASVLSYHVKGLHASNTLVALQLSDLLLGRLQLKPEL